MDNNFQNNQELIQKYLQGNLSESEELKLANWIYSSESNLQSFKKYITDNQFSQTHNDETDRAWQRIKVKLDNKTKQTGNGKIVVPNWLKVAALVALALISGILINKVSLFNSKELVWNEIIVPNGEKAQLILSDGSSVFLNSNSHLKYPSVFSEKNRKVNLSGEAFFNIKKDLSHPFNVETPGFDVTVTGTSFNLLAYNTDKENSVTMHSGSVTISKNGHDFKLRPGEKYILNNETQNSKIIQVDIKKSSLWKEGVIVIENLDLNEIIKILERKFNVKIEIADEKLKTIRYTGQFKPNEKLEDILALIRDTSPVKYSYKINKTNNLVTIEE